MFVIFCNFSISEVLFILSKLEQAKMFRSAKKNLFLCFHILIQFDFGEQITIKNNFSKQASENSERIQFYQFVIASIYSL